jgi:hypothetical protein
VLIAQKKFIDQKASYVTKIIVPSHAEGWLGVQGYEFNWFVHSVRKNLNVLSASQRIQKEVFIFVQKYAKTALLLYQNRPVWVVVNQ